MAGVFFIETLRRDWRQVIYWGMGLAVLGYILTAVIPDVESLNRYADMLQTLPPVILNMIGTENLAALTTPEGFIGFAYFTYALLTLAAFAILAGLSVTANEEEAGVLDVVLSLPVPRWRVIIERFAAYSVLAVAIIFMGLIGLLAGNAATPIEIDGGRLALGAINMIPATLLLIAVTMFASAVFRRRSTAVGLVAAFITANFFIDFIAGAVTHVATEILSLLSFFTYYDSQRVITEGLNLSNVLVLLIAAAALVVGALWFFERRDVGV